MEPNEKAFRELIMVYESIDAADIEYWLVNKDPDTLKLHEYLRIKTGFGDGKTCILCKAVAEPLIGWVSCDKCLWMIVTKDKCFGSNNKQTYRALDKYIVDTKNYDIEEITKTILDKINKRVKRMKLVLKRWKAKQYNSTSYSRK